MKKPSLVALSCLLVMVSGCGGSSGDDAPAPSPSPSPSPSPTPPPPPPPPPPPGPTSGLDARPSNTTCLAQARATVPASIGVERVFPNLTFNSPLGMMQAPGDSSRWFVLEKTGAIRVFENTAAVGAASSFLTLSVRSDNELGLLGLAFHPDWQTNRKAYVFYTSNTELANYVSEFTSADGGLTLNPGSERRLLRIVKPNGEGNHNGGNIAFGPDGFLYIGVGDGGGGNDQHGSIGNGQLNSTLHGKILRIDVDSTVTGAEYGIPNGNPFAGNATCDDSGNGATACPEIYAVGFRNPWRWSFDQQTGQLFVGDVGQSAREEIDRVVLGGNYGWRCIEGTLDTGMSCGSATNFQPPIAEYGRSLGQSTTGGFVYRGSAFPSLVGRYIFGDFETGRIWHISADTLPTLTVDSTTDGIDTNLSISSFGQSNDGEVFVVHFGGTLHRITATGGVQTGSPPAQLSATGCVMAGDPSQPAQALIPFAPNAPFWSDNAEKERWMALPNGQNITVESNGDWTFPPGTVLMKHFRIGNQLIETRLFMRHPDNGPNDGWAGYSYRWNGAGTDATLVAAGDQAVIGAQTWIFPSGDECMQCHTAVAGFTLGPETRQLAWNITYPQTGRTAHQLVTLNAINTLSPPISDPTLVDPYAHPFGAESVEDRARSYLHTNCSQCHRPGGPTPSNLDLRFSTALDQTNACDVAPSRGDLGIANARVIAPGDAARSVLLARVNSRVPGTAMPPLASTVVDDGGVALLTEWINGLANCN